METLQVQESLFCDTYRGQTVSVSPSMRSAISKQISPKLIAKTESDAHRRRLSELVCLSAKEYSAFCGYKNGICAMPFRIEALGSHFFLASCTLIWKARSGKKWVYPWEEVEAEALDVGILMDKRSIALYNLLLDTLYASKVEGGGLPFSYRVCRKRAPRSLVLDMEEEVNSDAIAAVRRSLHACTHREGQAPWPYQTGKRQITVSWEGAQESRPAYALLQALCDCPLPILCVTVT